MGFRDYLIGLNESILPKKINKSEFISLHNNNKFGLLGGVLVDIDKLTSMLKTAKLDELEWKDAKKYVDDPQEGAIENFYKTDIKGKTFYIYEDLRPYMSKTSVSRNFCMLYILKDEWPDRKVDRLPNLRIMTIFQ